MSAPGHRIISLKRSTNTLGNIRPVWRGNFTAISLRITDFKGDDNVDIEKYVGNGELKYLFTGQKANFSVQLRDSELSANFANVQVNWSYPMKDLFSMLEGSHLRFYAQYFNGYGETLIDYNIKRERIGFGVMLTDWL